MNDFAIEPSEWSIRIDDARFSDYPKFIMVRRIARMEGLGGGYWFGVYDQDRSCWNFKSKKFEIEGMPSGRTTRWYKSHRVEDLESAFAAARVAAAKAVKELKEKS